MKIQKEDKLSARWNKKEQDVELFYPIGVQTSCDAGYLATFFNQDFITEMWKRGYDITTFKFEISPLFPTNRPDKFKTLNEKYTIK